MKTEVVEVNEFELLPLDLRRAVTDIVSGLITWYHTYQSAHAALEKFGVDSPEYLRKRRLFDEVTQIMAHPNLFMEP